jgi:hypothetical protein
VACSSVLLLAVAAPGRVCRESYPSESVLFRLVNEQFSECQTPGGQSFHFDAGHRQAGQVQSVRARARRRHPSKQGRTYKCRPRNSGFGYSVGRARSPPASVLDCRERGECSVTPTKLLTRSVVCCEQPVGVEARCPEAGRIWNC